MGGKKKLTFMEKYGGDVLNSSELTAPIADLPLSRNFTETCETVLGWRTAPSSAPVEGLDVTQMENKNCSGASFSKHTKCLLVTILVWFGSAHYSEPGIRMFCAKGGAETPL